MRGNRPTAVLRRRLLSRVRGVRRRGAAAIHPDRIVRVLRTRRHASDVDPRRNQRGRRRVAVVVAIDPGAGLPDVLPYKLLKYQLLFLNKKAKLY